MGYGSSIRKARLPADYEQMRSRAAQKLDIFKKRSELRDKVLQLLVPAKDEIERRKSCDCSRIQAT